MTKSLRGRYPRMFGRILVFPLRSTLTLETATRTKGSQRSLREGQAVELQVVDSSQVGATHRVVADVRAAEHQAVGSNQVVVQRQVENRLVHRLHRMVPRKRREISDKDAQVPHILGGETESDRISNHL